MSPSLPSHDKARQRQAFIRLAVLAALALVAMSAFMVLGARGNWAFVLPFRGAKLAALLLVAYAIAVSTVLFQTVTGNRILTPSIMGFDALYVLIQTILIFFIGSAEVTGANPHLMFGLETVAMVVFAGLLFRWIFSEAESSLHLLLLVGVVIGTLFRSLSGFLQRIIDPDEFLILQDRLFASFNMVDTSLLGIAASVVAVTSFIGYRFMSTYDVMALGRDNAISLGVNHKRMVTLVLAMVSVLVSVSTALVGPVVFFGLLVANLAYMLMPTSRHVFVLPAAVLLAIVFLVGGQVVLERVFAFDTALSIIIEFIGGLLFIAMVLRGVAR